MAMRGGGNIAFPTLTISGTPVTTATVGVPYAGFTVSGGGGVPPYHYSVVAGTLPTGITLNTSTGLVSGTPTVEQTQTGIVIRVTDAAVQTADLAPFQIEVAPDGALRQRDGSPILTRAGEFILLR
jgi:hypothetical protein